MPYLTCFKCGIRFFGTPDESVPKEKYLCDECFNESRGLTRSQF